MPVAQVVRQLVCSECGQPIAQEPVTTALIERTAPRTDDDLDDDVVAEDQEVEIDTLIEEGPVCPRCAGYR